LKETYGFNSVHELTSQAVDNATFMWHPASAGTVSYGTANSMNQYPSVGGNSFTYNSNGCLTDDGVWDFGYDTMNRLVSADNGTTSASYLYDPSGRQTQKEVNSTKTRYIHAGIRIIAEYDGSDTLVKRYVHGPGLDEVLFEIDSSNDVTYLHHDRLGSIIATTDDTGAVIDTYAYSPWGESGSMSGTTFGFTGQRYDAETGLYFYKNRHYSPAIGRFLQPDPIGYGDGLNMYQYGYNDPNSFTDPLGTAADGSSMGSDTGGSFNASISGQALISFDSNAPFIKRGDLAVWLHRTGGVPGTTFWVYSEPGYSYRLGDGAPQPWTWLGREYQQYWVNAVNEFIDANKMSFSAPEIPNDVEKAWVNAFHDDVRHQLAIGYSPLVYRTWDTATEFAMTIRENPLFPNQSNKDDLKKNQEAYDLAKQVGSYAEFATLVIRNAWRKRFMVAVSADKFGVTDSEYNAKF